MSIIKNINKFLYSKYTLLFFSLVLFIILSPYADLSLLAKLFLNFLTVFVFLSVLLAVPQNRRHYVFFISLALLLFILNVIYTFHYDKSFSVLNSTMFIIFCLSAMYSFMQEIKNKEEITQDIIIGAICIYLLIGITYSNIYNIINIFHPGSFQVVATKTAPGSFDFLYFSFTTLCTVGFGDIVSTSIYSKPFVILESITGIFYVAILVARLVNAFTRQK